MNRRDIIRSIFFGAASAKTLMSQGNTANEIAEDIPVDTPTRFKSKWHLYPDMPWTGDDIWVQRLQDWYIQNGELQCMAHGVDRTVHILTHQLSSEKKSFKAEIEIRFLNKNINDSVLENHAGFRLGVKGRYEDYRSAIMTGKGIDIGITRNGFLFIGKSVGEKKIDESVLTEKIKLSLSVTAQSTGNYFTKLKATDKHGNTIAAMSSSELDAESYHGNISIVSHFKSNKENENLPSIAVSNFFIEGEKLVHHPNHVFGAVYFAQYTLQSHTLKLTAQLAPVDIPASESILYIQKENNWKKIATSKIHPLARIATFRVENWETANSFPYKVVYEIKLRNGKKKEYSYEGTIAAEPKNKSSIKALAFSCNWDYGFPDNEVVENASMHNADMAFFLGDQFYEPNGGFGVQMFPLEKSSLDYLRKWYMFGWSYRNLFRHIPMVALPDDHDMYHGNIWGTGGRPTKPLFDGAAAQDSGGYKMLPEWVNMAQLTQTSHMPDAYDATPVSQGINVYYTEWDYGGISFGIIEDRKFKSPPKEILPEEAKVWNGYAANPSYDHSKIKDLEAQLLGERQISFLEQWSKKKIANSAFKVLVSATPFCCLQTLPEGTKNDQITPDLTVPASGVYISGDVQTKDMDSNGWPHSRRNEALKILGKNIHLHLVGDQHLPSIIQYGTDEYEDSIFCFAVPALCNFWPRRWWPAVNDEHNPLPGKPKYTGRFMDGFENKITVHAVANPVQTNRLPALLYDRPSGYGVIEFNKSDEKIIMHCWPRYINPSKGNSGQYENWPLTIHKQSSL